MLTHLESAAPAAAVATTINEKQIKDSTQWINHPLVKSKYQWIHTLGNGTLFFFFITETVRVHSSVVSSISVSDPDILKTLFSVLTRRSQNDTQFQTNTIFNTQPHHQFLLVQFTTYFQYRIKWYSKWFSFIINIFLMWWYSIFFVF